MEKGKRGIDNLYEMIKKADSGDPEAQWRVAWYIVWSGKNEPIEPDWLERALDYFQRSAAQGYGNAMLELGAMYSSGRGVAKDEAEAICWYEKAAGILHPKAFRCLGYSLGFHNFRDGGFADYKTAFGYFFKGALLDEPNCIYEIGDMYYWGRYVDSDQKFAFKLYQESYEIIDGNIEDDSYANVCLRIGECFYKGIGPERDLDLAREHLLEAMEGFELRVKRSDPPEFFINDYDKAKRLLRELEAGGASEQPPASMTCQEENDYIEFINSDMMKYPEPAYPIEELERLKSENPLIEFDGYEPYNFNDKLAAAEAGDSTAMYHVAFYLFSHLVDESKSQSMMEFALFYYYKAIQCGCRYATPDLGVIYDTGHRGVAVDKKKAYLLFLYANDSEGSNAIGVYYAEGGEVVTQDYEKAFKCFARSALEKEKGSLFNLGKMYHNGLFVDIDEKFADHCKSLGEKVIERCGYYTFNV